MSDAPGQRNIIGKRIREARRRAQPMVSQEDLAARLARKGVFFDRSAISRMEAERRFVRDYEALAIADCLKVSIGWLFGREEKERKE
jgi:transcriptional regulator with XRE-family HTH domain